MTLSHFIKLLRKHLRLLILLPIALGVAMFVLAINLPDEYTAETSMYILTRSETAEGEASSTSQYSDLSASQMLSDDLSTIITSKRVKSDVATAVGLDNLDDYSLDVTSSSNTRVIILDVTGADANEAAAIANAVVQDVSTVATDIMSVQSVNVIDPATVPTEPSGPLRPLYVVGGVFLGLFLAIIIIIIQYMLDTRVRSEDEITSRVNAPVIAHYQQLKGSLIPRNRSKRTDETVDNSSKTLLANIRFMNVDRPVRTIVVTSAITNEGKTFISSSLAQAIATSGKTVLLIECDMRRRSMAGALGIHPEHGLYAVMSQEVPLTTAAVQTSTEGMFFLDAEPHIPNPSDLINSKGFSRMIDEATRTFDYVIFDTPPVGTFVDAAVLGRKVDATMLVIREGVVHRDDVTQAIDQLKKAGVNLAGIIMNGCESKQSDYYYRYNKGAKSHNKKNKEDESSHELVSASEVMNASRPQSLNNDPNIDGVTLKVGNPEHKSNTLTV